MATLGLFGSTCCVAACVPYDNFPENMNIGRDKQTIVLPAKSDSEYMFCLQHYQGPIIYRSLVY